MRGHSRRNAVPWRSGRTTKVEKGTCYPLQTRKEMVPGGWTKRRRCKLLDLSLWCASDRDRSEAFGLENVL